MQLLLSARSARWLLGVTLGLLALRPLGVTAQNVGIGTTQPTQALDVNGQLRVRGLSGPGGLPQVQPDGTLGLYGPPARRGPDPYAAEPVQLGQGDRWMERTPSMAVSGNMLYVTQSNPDKLLIFDVSNPATPAWRGEIGTGGRLMGIAVSGNTLYGVGQLTAQLQVFDVSNPAAPVLLGSVGTGGTPSQVALSGTTACVVNTGSSTLQTFDVSNPAAPVLLATVPTGSGPRSLAVSGTTGVVVNETSNTLQTFDLSNPAAPVLRGTVATGARPYSVAVSGTTAFVVNFSGNTLQAFSVATPTAPALLGSIGTGSAPYQVAITGTTACVVNVNNLTLQTFDVRNPAAPMLLGSVGTPFLAISLAVGSTFAYAGPLIGGYIPAYRVGSTPALGLQPDGTLGPASSPRLTLAGQTLGISDGNAVTLPTQTLSLTGQQLSLSNGGAVTLPTAPGDNLGNHTATQPIQYSTNDTDKFYFTQSGGANGSKLAHGIGWTLDYYAGPNNGLAGTHRFLTGTAAGWQERLRIAADGNVGIGTAAPSFKLDVNGAIRCVGAVTTTSDQRLKQQIRPIGGALAQAQALRGVRYTFRQGHYAGLNLPAGEQIGFLAQEVEKVFPELVSTDGQGYKAVNYAQLTPVLLEALKELAAQNDALRRQQTNAAAALQAQQTQLTAQQAQLDALQRRLDAAPVGTARR